MAKWNIEDNTETKYAIFTCLSQFKITYAIPMEDGDTLESLSDLIVCEEIEQFSQSHLGEIIIDSTCLSEKDMLLLFNKENAYLANWTDEQKVKWVKRIASIPK